MCLCHTCKLSILNMTDSSGNTSIIAQCISKPEAGHTDMEFSILWLFLHKIIMHLHISFFSIIIICIDNNKRLIQNLLCRKYSLSGSPGFRAVSRFRKSLRQIIKLLEYIFYFRNFLNTLADHSAKLFFQIFTDNKHYFIKSGFQRIVDGIIHNNLSTWSHRCKLLDSFSKTTSDSCRHNYKCCFLHKYFPPDIFFSHINTFSVIFCHIPSPQYSIPHPEDYLILLPDLLRSDCQ